MVHMVSPHRRDDGGATLGKRPAERDPRLDELAGVTAKGKKRTREETDTSVLGVDLKCRDKSTNAKSVLNELVQQKGWRLSYAHERRWTHVWTKARAADR